MSDFHRCCIAATVIGTTGAAIDISPSVAPAEHGYDPEKKGADVIRYTGALRKLRLVGRKDWGTMWTDTGAIAIMKVCATSAWFSPPWWRMENDIVYCLR